MKLFRQIRKIILSKPEKEDIRGVLLSFIKENPVRNYTDNRHKVEKVPFLQLFFNHKPMVVTLIAAILIAFGGGTAAAAENTLPGDWLYPVKVNINEEVRAVLTASAEAKVAWDARRAERRLEEAEKLAQNGKLTTSTSRMLADKFEGFSNKANVRLEKLQTAGKLTEEQVEELKENFEVAIKAHDEVLSRIQDKAQEKEELKAVVESLREQASSTIKSRLEHEWKLLKDNTSSSTLKIAAENRKNAAQNKIAEVEKFIGNNFDKVSEDNKAEASKKLTEAKNIVVEGDKAYRETKYGEAIIKYSEAHRKAQEAQMYMTARFRLERKVEATSSTPVVFATGSLQFNNEKRQEVWDTRENLREVEQKLREEVKQAKEKIQEFKKEEREKIKEVIRQNKPEKTSTDTVSD